MEITDVKVKLVQRQNNKLKAFCAVTFDNAFVVKDIRVIQGLKGTIIAMPAKKLTYKCFKCGFKNELRAKFCSECGCRIYPTFMKRDSQTGRPVTQVDVAHPLNQETRTALEKKILEAYEKEFDKYKQSLAQPPETQPPETQPPETQPPEAQPALPPIEQPPAEEGEIKPDP